MTEESRVVARRRQWDALDEGLSELRSCRDAEELANAACPLGMVCCDSDHVALGRTRDGVWSPWRQAGGDDAVVALVPRTPIALEEAPFERGVVRTGTTAVREGHRDGGTRTTRPAVVVAGVRSAGEVVGLLHVAAGESTDPAIVEAYADALSSMFALLEVQARVRVQDRLFGSLRRDVEDLRQDVSTELVPERRAASPGPVPPGGTPTGHVRERLTARQREVLDLMLAGLSNAQIAERLVLAIPTVKSHVRGVLRAVGAVNRSEAVARFGRGDTSDPGG